MTQESSAQKPCGDIVIEAFSRTITRDPFRQSTETKFWSFRQGEKLQAIPDKNSQVDFKLQPKSLSMSPDLILEIPTIDNTTIIMKGVVTPEEGDESVLVTLTGIRLTADRNPDAQSIPPKIVGIDHC